MIDCGDKMIKTSRKIDKSKTYKSLVARIFHSFFFQELPQTKHFFKYSTFQQMNK